MQKLRSKVHMIEGTLTNAYAGKGVFSFEIPNHIRNYVLLAISNDALESYSENDHTVPPTLERPRTETILANNRILMESAYDDSVFKKITSDFYVFKDLVKILNVHPAELSNNFGTLEKNLELQVQWAVSQIGHPTYNEYGTAYKLILSIIELD